MSRWVAMEGELTTQDASPRTAWLATAIDGWEPALHPLFDTQAEAVELCEALNTLGWDEDKFFANSRQVMRAVEEGTLPALVARRAARGFWRGLLDGLWGAW